MKSFRESQSSRLVQQKKMNVPSNTWVSSMKYAIAADISKFFKQNSQLVARGLKL